MDEKYYSASEVAKIKGIKRQSVIDGCKRGKYLGAFKTPPDSMNTQGVWRIPVCAIDTSAVITQDVVTINHQLTPQELQYAFQEAIRQEIAPLQKELQDQRQLLNAIYQRQDEKITKAIPNREKPWWKFW